MLKALDWRESFKVEDILPRPSWHDFWDMDPLMIIGYTVIGGTGLFAFGMARLEKKLIEKDDDRGLLIGAIAKAILMGAGIAGVVYFVIFKNPIWKFL
jgi:hypothetical protein